MTTIKRKLEQYFKAINNPLDPFYSPDEDILFFNERYENNEFNVMFEELNIDISQQEILKAVNQLKTNKSGGPDKIINEFFIHGKNIFRPEMSTVDNIFVLHGLISHVLNSGRKLYCAFIDFTKAFDYMVREIYGIN